MSTAGGSLRVVRVCAQFPPAPGGLAPGMLSLSLAQHRAGHQVSVITRAAEGAPEVDSALPFPVHRLGTQSHLGMGWRARALVSAMGSEVDVVHVHGPEGAALLLPGPLSLTPPVVYSLHAVRRYQYSLFQDLGGLVEEVTGGRAPLVPPPRYGFWRPDVAKQLALERWMCRRADHLALVAEYFREQVEGYYGVVSDRLTVTYNGGDLPGAGSQESVQAPEAEVPMVLFVGRVDWVKRVHLLVLALREIRRVHPGASLCIVGDGDQLSDLRSLVKRLQLESCVEFRGWIPHHELDAIYRSASCLCLPSIWEGLPKVLLEAMGMGMPVVASDIPANRELLRGGELGALVPAPRSSEWAAAISRAIRRDGEAVVRARRAREAVMDRFLWDHVSHRLSGAYHHALGSIEGSEEPSRSVT